MLAIDGSKKGMGAVLCQIDVDGKKIMSLMLPAVIMMKIIMKVAKEDAKRCKDAHDYSTFS